VLEKGKITLNNASNEREKYPWAGPLLFTVVLAGIVAFYWWFVQA
jgi:hypothetical protein